MRRFLLTVLTLEVTAVGLMGGYLIGTALHG